MLPQEWKNVWLSGLWLVLVWSLTTMSLQAGNGLESSDSESGVEDYETNENAVQDEKVEASADGDIVLEAKSCLEILQNNLNAVSGEYTIDPSGNGTPINCYCDMITEGGGWTVIQRRQDGSEGFYRNWADYKNGFGSPIGEYWLGNDLIHLLTNAPKELRIEMMRENGETRYASYSSFSIAGESALYRLSISGYSGSAGDGMAYHNGRYFSTFDRDNDIYAGHCAVKYKGGWWYGACHHSNLNGLYLNGPHSTYADGVEWHFWTGPYNSLVYVEMMIR